MVFLTVGTQQPFDRLVRIVDEVAGRLDLKVVGQIGESDYRPSHIKHQAVMLPTDFQKHVAGADIIIAHAGIGTILVAQQHRKPLIIFPRRASFNEQFHDHQLATCAHMENAPGIHVAYTQEDLERLLTGAASLGSTVWDDGANAERIEFIRNLRSYLERLR